MIKSINGNDCNLGLFFYLFNNSLLCFYVDLLHKIHDFQSEENNFARLQLKNTGTDIDFKDDLSRRNNVIEKRKNTTREKLEYDKVAL